jgi:hypothetical protein
LPTSRWSARLLLSRRILVVVAVIHGVGILLVLAIIVVVFVFLALLIVVLIVFIAFFILCPVCVPILRLLLPLDAAS